MFFEQTQIFDEGLSNRYIFSRKSICQSVCRKDYLIEQILIFPETLIVLKHVQIFQDPLFSHRTNINFPASSIFPSISIFQDPLFYRTDILFPGSPSCSPGCFRYLFKNSFLFILCYSP